MTELKNRIVIKTRSEAHSEEELLEANEELMKKLSAVLPSVVSGLQKLIHDPKGADVDAIVREVKERMTDTVTGVWANPVFCFDRATGQCYCCHAGGSTAVSGEYQVIDEYCVPVGRGNCGPGTPLCDD